MDLAEHVLLAEAPQKSRALHSYMLPTLRPAQLSHART